MRRPGLTALPPEDPVGGDCDRAPLREVCNITTHKTAQHALSTLAASRSGALTLELESDGRESVAELLPTKRRRPGAVSGKTG